MTALQSVAVRIHGTIEPRYTVAQEWSGYPEPRWVARWRGDPSAPKHGWLGGSVDPDAAIELCREHHRNRAATWCDGCAG